MSSRKIIAQQFVINQNNDGFLSFHKDPQNGPRANPEHKGYNVACSKPVDQILQPTLLFGH